MARNEVFLKDICLPTVEKIQNCQESIKLHSSHVDYWMMMLVSAEQLQEEWAERSQDHLVSLNLLAIFTDQSHIFKVFVLPQIFKRTFDIFLEVIPLKTKFF